MNYCECQHLKVAKMTFTAIWRAAWNSCLARQIGCATMSVASGSFEPDEITFGDIAKEAERMFGVASGEMMDLARAGYADSLWEEGNE